MSVSVGQNPRLRHCKIWGRQNGGQAEAFLQGNRKINSVARALDSVQIYVHIICISDVFKNNSNISVAISL